MERKVKFGVNVLLILGIVFSAIGGIYVVIALGVAFSGASQAEPGFPLIFGGIGGVFLVLGLVFLGVELGKRRKIRAMVLSGHYVWGTIVSIDWDTHVRINGRNPQVAVAQYCHGSKQHYFTSRHLPRYCSDTLIGQKVRIYCQAPDFSCYYVDLEPLLANHILH